MDVQREKLMQEKQRRWRYGRGKLSIYSGKKEEGQWIKRSKNELESLYKKSRISQTIRSQKIRGLGNMTSMKEERLIKQTLTKEVAGRRGKGRPRTIQI